MIIIILCFVVKGYKVASVCTHIIYDYNHDLGLDLFFFGAGAWRFVF